VFIRVNVVIGIDVVDVVTLNGFFEGLDFNRISGYRLRLEEFAGESGMNRVFLRSVGFPGVALSGFCFQRIVLGGLSRKLFTHIRFFHFLRFSVHNSFKKFFAFFVVSLVKHHKNIIAYRCDALNCLSRTEIKQLIFRDFFFIERKHGVFL